jgi:hypothetical protein
MNGAERVTNGPKTLTVCLALVAIGAIAMAGKAALGVQVGLSHGLGMDAWQAWPAEFASLLGLLLALPVVVAADRLVRSKLPMPVRIGGVLLGSILFTLVHFAGTAAVRAALMNGSHPFDPARHGPYEPATALVAYAVALVAFLAARRMVPAPVASAEPRIAESEECLEEAPGEPSPLVVLADAGRSVEVDVRDLSAVSGGGNYVELIFRSGKRTTLRMTLGAAEEALAACGLRRTHKSWLVRLAEIRAIERTPSGDFRLLLGQGLEAPLSRRHRALSKELRTAAQPADEIQE